MNARDTLPVEAVPREVAQTRQQMFANSSHRPRGIQRVRLGAERDGRLTAIGHDAWMQTTPYDEFIEQGAAFSRVMYAAPNRLHRHWGVKLDLPASDIKRAPGEARVRRMLGVFACGRVLNAKTARSQLIGGMIMGVGAALTEESLLDTRYGAFVNHDLAEYHIPVHADIGEIDAVLLPEIERYVNPLGIKGLGEVGIVGAAAAVANAVFDATGVRVREFPVTLDKVLGGLVSRPQHSA